MSITKYSALKEHFDRLVLGQYPATTGIEPIRSTYECAFNMNINMQDVYESKLFIQTNPIKSLITLIGPDPKDGNDIPTGLIGLNELSISYITHYTDNIFRDSINEKEAESYIKNVFNSMRNIMSCDSMFNIKLLRNNPYITTLYVYPFYFTYHHIKYALPNLLSNKAFYDIFEEYYNDIDYFDDVIKSLNENKYTADTELIYSIMTCKNTIPIV